MATWQPRLSSTKTNETCEYSLFNTNAPYDGFQTRNTCHVMSEKRLKLHINNLDFRQLHFRQQQIIQRTSPKHPKSVRLWSMQTASPAKETYSRLSAWRIVVWMVKFWETATDNVQLWNSICHETSGHSRHIHVGLFSISDRQCFHRRRRCEDFNVFSKKKRVGSPM